VPHRWYLRLKWAALAAIPLVAAVGFAGLPPLRGPRGDVVLVQRGAAVVFHQPVTMSLRRRRLLSGLPLLPRYARDPAGGGFILVVPLWPVAAASAAAYLWCGRRAAALKPGPGRCAACGYDLAALRGEVCPECGARTPSAP
jgi:hypothetical protein